jgi:MFS family permease
MDTIARDQEVLVSDTDGPRIFFGWWTLLAVFVVMTAGSGFAFYAQGVYLNALVEEQGFSTSAASAGTAIFFVAQGIGGYFTGSLISRFDARVVITFGAIVSAAGIALLGEVRNEWQMAGVFVLFGAGYALAGLVPATSIVTRWFHRRRSVALSIASSGLSLGGIVVTRKLSSVIENETLADSAQLIALVYMAMMIPIVWLLLRPSPESMGLRPDGEAALKVGEVAPPPDGWDYDDAIHSRYFKVLSFAFVLLMAAQVGAIQHLFKLVADRVDTNAARLGVSLLAGVSVVARISGGIAAAKMSISKLISFLIVVQTIGIAIIGVSTSKTPIMIGVVVMGLAIGNLLMLHPLLLAQAFGVKDYPRIYGTASLLMVFGVASGPFMVGALRDLTSYRTAFLVMAALAVFGGLVFRTMGEPGEPGDHHRRTHNRPSTPRSTRSLLAPVVFDVTEVTVDA